MAYFWNRNTKRNFIQKMKEFLKKVTRLVWAYKFSLITFIYFCVIMKYSLYYVSRCSVLNALSFSIYLYSK